MLHNKGLLKIKAIGKLIQYYIPQSFFFFTELLNPEVRIPKTGIVSGQGGMINRFLKKKKKKILSVILTTSEF